MATPSIPQSIPNPEQVALDPRLANLLSRRSTLARELQSPGPSDAQLDEILRVAVRVPDHGRLSPWRFIIIEGEARHRLGVGLVEAYLANVDPDARTHRCQQVEETFLRAPLIIAVVSRASEGKIPVWEQVLSCGAVCQNLLHACHALGFRAQWLTEWYAYDTLVLELLGLSALERIAGFVYVGSNPNPPAERARAQVQEVTTRWVG